MNRPFPYGSGNEEIIETFRSDLLTRAREFKPQLTLISAGFDSRVNDPIGGFQIDDNGFKTLTGIMNEISEISGQGRLVSVLEGGYDISGLTSAVLVHMQALLD
jgi:acetoin utilization deacetylase AcuC-like enzyme